MERFFDDHNNQIISFVTKFNGYSPDIDATAIRNWIRQFDAADWDLALKLLGWVDYYDHEHVCRELQALHQQISTLAGFNIGNSYFAPFCQVGHSGEVIVERYRFANGLKSHSFDNRFIHLSQLNLLYNQEDALFFFMEDFIGTGDSTFKIWEKVSDYVPSDKNLFLLVITGHQEAINRIEANLPLKVLSNRAIHDDTKIFSDLNTLFSRDEKTKIREYCQRAGSEPEGYGKSQSNVVFYYRAPDNIISILRSNNPNWKGLFIRNV